MRELVGLTRYDYAQLAETFNNAFSDYVLPINVSAAGLKAMLHSRSYVPELSYGIAISGVLSGFICVGEREIAGKPERYVCSMGIVPGRRRHGLAGELLSVVKRDVLSANICRFCLEVITTNDKAVALYIKHGFTVKRELVCLKVAKNLLSSLSEHSVEPIALNDLSKAGDEFFDFMPTWQNQFTTVERLPEETVKSAKITVDGRLGGFIVGNQSGSIMQLAVRRQCRRRGIGKALLANFAKIVPSDFLSVVNVEAGQPLIHFLTWCGFNEFIRQYEMAFCEVEARQC